MHAALVHHQNGGLYLIDLKSSHHSFVDNKPLRPYEACLLRDGAAAAPKGPPAPREVRKPQRPRLVAPGAPAAPADPGAPPERLGSLPWPQELASACSKG